MTTIVCPKCGHENTDTAANCANCRVNLQWALENPEQFQTQAQTTAARVEIEQRKTNLIVTTTFSIENRAITQYLDVVTAEVVLGTGLLSELSAGIADLLGVRADKFQSKLREAKETALRELKNQAFQMGADAVVGTALNYMTFANNMLMLSASGTAVKLASDNGNKAPEQ